MTDRPNCAERVISLAQALIARPSVTPEDAGCLELLAARLEPLGFVGERLDAGGVSNLWARRGERAPLIVLAGHTDVVPPGPEHAWRYPPFSPTLAEDDSGTLCLWGRGAADMKGSLAAMVVAVEELLAETPDFPASLAFLLTSDEEGPAVHGTRQVVEVLRARGETLDYCIVGEPTSATQLGDTIKNGRRGSLTGVLTVLGKQGHVAYPHLADNAVHRALPALLELTQRHWDDGNADFPPTTFQIAYCQAGSGATNVIPGECRVVFNFRFNTEQTPERLIAAVEESLRHHGVRYQLEWTLSGMPFLTPRGTLVEAVQRAIAEVTGVAAQCSTTGGTSDGRFIATLCPQVVEFGPINATIHQIDERVAVDDLVRLSEIYRRTLRRLANGL